VGDVLELQGLTRRHGDLVALDDLPFTVAEEQMFGFVGPNGAGKTTAMHMSQRKTRCRALGCCCQATVGYDPPAALACPTGPPYPNQADSLVGCSWRWPNGELAAADLAT
jgi:hypothetical protein